MGAAGQEAPLQAKPHGLGSMDGRGRMGWGIKLGPGTGGRSEESGGSGTSAQLFWPKECCSCPRFLAHLCQGPARCYGAQLRPDRRKDSTCQQLVFRPAQDNWTRWTQTPWETRI